MSFRDHQSSLEDILASIDEIQDFVADSDLAAYRTDRSTRLAVERLLQNLTEAAYRLGSDAELLCPAIDWRGIRELGNMLQHEYDDIDDEIVWQAIQTRLPPLKTAVEDALAKLTCADQSEA